MKKKKKNGMTHGMTASGPMVKIGMMAIGPQKNCNYYKDEYGYFRKKGHGKKGKKGKKGKDDEGKKEVNQEMEKAGPTMFNLSLHRLLLSRIKHIAGPLLLCSI